MEARGARYDEALLPDAMIRALFLAFALAGTPLAASLVPSGTGGDLDLAVARFRESLSETEAARTSALNDLVALADPGATPVLAEEYAADL